MKNGWQNKKPSKQELITKDWFNDDDTKVKWNLKNRPDLSMNFNVNSRKKEGDLVKSYGIKKTINAFVVSVQVL